MLNPFNLSPNKKLIKKQGFDLVLIIDRSGSMEGTERNIIAGHQRLVNYLKRISESITLTTILFDDDIVIACDGKRLDEIKKLDYRPDGFTALFDAWGTAIIHENERKKNNNNPYPNADVLYLTVTDGGENSSKIFNLQKIKDLMMQERRRSIEGHGIREFATVNEFGVDAQQLEKDIKLGKHNSQIFYRGDAGLDVLFKIIELAAENVIQYRRITEKWIKKSDQLKIGSYTLGQLKEMTKKPQRILANVEKKYMELLFIADNGLSDEFWSAYHKYSDLVKKLEKIDILNTGDEEIDSILGLYIGKHDTNQRLALQQAKDATVNKAAVRCAACLGKIRKIADNKESTAKELYEAVNLYNESIRKLDFLPSVFTHLKSARIADKISDIIDEHNKRYKEIIFAFFKLRIDLIKEVLGTADKQVFRRLAGFTKEPLYSLFDSFPVYNEFCNWFDTVNKEMNNTGINSDQPDDVTSNVNALN